MLRHHEPSTTIDYASLSPEQRAGVVHHAMRRAHAERARVIGAMAGRLVSTLAFWRGARGGDVSAHGTPTNLARPA